MNRYKQAARWLVLSWMVGLSTFSLGVNAQAQAGRLVGDLGRSEAIVLSGNDTFTKEQILRGMLWHIDWHVAAHPMAPLGEFVVLLERKITQGYLRAGFPDVTVEAVADTNAHQVTVTIKEGPRYRCRDIILTGVKSMINDVVRERVTSMVSGLEPGQSTVTNHNTFLWLRSMPVPYDEVAKERLLQLAEGALEQLDYYQTKVSVRIVPDASQRLADLEVNIADEGIKGTIQEIEVNGLGSNTRAETLDYLKLKPGLELHPNLLHSLSNQLWSSGRFLHHDVLVTPLKDVGKFKLTVELDELKGVPRLGTELSPETKALLNFRDWIMNWEKRPDDFFFSLTSTTQMGRVTLEVALSSSGLAILLRTAQSNEPPALLYGTVLSTEVLGFYSPARRTKYAAKRSGGELRLSASIVPETNPGNASRFSVNLTGGYVAEGEQPFTLELLLTPAAFVDKVQTEQKSISIKNGIFRLAKVFEEDNSTFNLDVEAESGRLLAMIYRDDATTMQIRSEEGVFARLVREIASATAELPNDYNPNRGFTSWIGFMTTELIHSKLPELLPQWLAAGATNDAVRAQRTAQINELKPLLALARTLLTKERLAEILGPLEWLPQKSDDTEAEDFFVPLPGPPGGGGADPMISALAAGALAYADTLLPRDSWLWVLLRETAFTFVGQSKYAETEMAKLRGSDDVGPVGCLAAAALLGQFDPKAARAVAEAGLSRLDATDLRKDLQIVRETNSVTGQILAKILSMFGSLKDLPITAIATNLPPAEAAFVQELARLVGPGGPEPAIDRAWPAIERYWTNTANAYVAHGLRHFLPQAQILTDPKALFDRGVALMSSDGVLKDVDEAAQCFRKAADLGHGGAQISMGLLHEQGSGVRQDFGEAMRWYRKALEQNTPHAACRIAELYHEGKGVSKNLDEAAKLYLAEAERDCTGAQFFLGTIHEEKLEMPEALKWFRRAAEGGDGRAQARLGELLSEGLFVPRDYIEACQWMALAAQDEENKIIQISLRRLKSKMTQEQLDEAFKRVHAFNDRKAEKEKAK